MKDLKDIEQAVGSYGIHSPFVREMVKTWAVSNKVIPHDSFSQSSCAGM